MLKHFIALIILMPFCNISAKEIRLRGRVLDQDQAAVAYANVFVDSLFITSASDANGRYELELDSAGNYTICVSHIAYERTQQELTLHRGDNALNFQLKPCNTTLSQVVVTGTGTQHLVDHTPIKTEIISEKDIKEIEGRNIEEVIAQLSSAFDYTTTSMGTNLKINGLGKDYVLVLVNGKRMTGGTGGYADLSRLNLNNIQQIEIVKGAASTLYGSDAIAGVINIITKKNNDALSLTNHTRRGAYNELKQLNTISYSRGAVSGKSSLSYKQSDGWQLSPLKYNTKWESNHQLPYLVETYDKPVNKTRGYTLTQELDYKVTEQLLLTSELSWYEKTLYFPFKGRMHNYYYNNRSAGIGAHYKLYSKNYIDLNLTYNNYLYYSEYPWKYNETYITKSEVIRATYYPGDRFKNTDEHNLRAEVRGVFRYKKHKLNTGAEWMYEKLEATYRLTAPVVRAHTLGLYAQDEVCLSQNLSIVAGLRAIHHTTAGGMLTPKLTTMYKQKHLTHRLSYANGFKSPTLKELYYFYESERMGIYRLYMGNEKLKPQKSNYFALSSDYKQGLFRTGYTLYINSIRDMIDYKVVPTPSAMKSNGIEETKMRYNINRARNYGIDYHIGITLLDQLSLNGGYSYVSARNVTQDIRLNGVSEHSATFKAQWRKEWQKVHTNLSLTGVYKSDRFYLEEDMRRSYAKPYQLWKITNNYYLKTIRKTDLHLYIGIDNILDKVDDSPYGSHYGSLNPGRTIFGGINLKFIH